MGTNVHRMLTTALLSAGLIAVPQLTGVHAPAAWRTTQGRGVVVAVVDSGVDAGHPALRGHLAPGLGGPDAFGHGTHVGGIVATCAPAARVQPVHVLDAGGAARESTVAAGVDWAVSHGARVINLSLDTAAPAPGGPLGAALEAAARSHVVVVAAAGNTGTPRRLWPSGVPMVVVGATGAPFTSSGDARQVDAPGTDVVSSVPTYPTTLFPDPGDGYGRLSGTSVATAFVSCEAALLLASGLRPEAVPERIRSTATRGTVDLAAALRPPHHSPATLLAAVAVAVAVAALASIALLVSRRRAITRTAASSTEAL